MHGANGILEDGFKTLITFDLNPNVKLEEIEVTPPGMKAGGKIKTTTQRNTEVHTGAPKALVDFDGGQVLVAWNPACYTDILTTLIRKNGKITITYPDGATHVYWGFIDEFTPKALKEGERPEADVKFELTNRNANGVETKPAYTAGTTTTST